MGTRKTEVSSSDIARMLDELNDYHTTFVAGVRMQVETEPARGKSMMYHLSVNGKRVSTKQFSPGTGPKTHPFGGAGGVAEAVFRQAANS